VIKLWLFIRTALSGLRQTPFVHGVAVLTLAIALFAGAMARAAQAGVDALLGHLGTDVEVTVYLSENASSEAIESLRVALEQAAGGRVVQVSPQEALARLTRELGDDGAAVLQGLPENPLPRTLELFPPSVPPDPARLRELATRFAKLPGVAGVDYGREWVDRLAQLRQAVGVGASVVLLLVLLAAVVVVAATLQLGMYARRDEIEIQKLVGATDLFVRVPYVLEGLIQGVIAGGVAICALYLCQRLLGPRVAEALVGLVQAAPPLGLTAPRLLGEVLGLGALLGGLGSAIAVGRFLRV
jgi:cell division transport system permease protein